MRIRKNLEAGDLRRLWPLKRGIAFLNHGSFGSCPKAILALQAELRRQMEAEPVQFLWRRYEEHLDPSRRAVAKFIGARPHDVVFVPTATAGVNAVVRSLDLRPGDEILTTSHDYNACRNVLVEAARRARAKVAIAEIPLPITSPDQAVEAVLKAVTKRTRLALLDHVTSSTALVLPLERIVRELNRCGVDTLVDGAHAPGVLPMNMPKIGASYYTANLHKWVCAPKGTAFLWVREDKQDNVQPVSISHGNNTPRPGFTRFQDRFDWTGTVDPTGWFCAGATIHWMSTLLPGGFAEIRRRNHQLAVAARKLLCASFNTQLPCPDSMIGAMATIELPAPFQGRPKLGKIDPEQLRLYDDFGVEVPFFRIGKPQRGCLRISAQVYNTMDDYERLAEAMGKLVRS